MFNEMELKQGVNAKPEADAKQTEDDKLKTSASDQIITFLDGTKYVRRLGETVPVPLAGETINLLPGSYHFLGLLKSKIQNASTRMSAIAVASKAVLDELKLYDEAKGASSGKRAKKKEGANAGEQEDVLETLAEKIGAIYKGMDDVRMITREAKLETVQFIIYDLKIPDWYEAVGEGMPSADAIEKQCPKERLLRKARREEIDNFLHVYTQMHKAALPAESFFGLQSVI